MARRTYLALYDATSMPHSQQQTPISPPTQAPDLLTLPRELRDQIYTLCATPNPQSFGPLTGYSSPQIELLKVNKQLRAEYQEIFYKLLPDLLNSNRVCLTVPTNIGGDCKGGKVAKKYCIGWHFWNLPVLPWDQLDSLSSTAEDQSVKRAVEGELQIWVHRVPGEDESEVEWWMDVVSISERATPGRNAVLPREVAEVERLLHRILGNGRVDQGRLGRIEKVQKKLREAVEREEARQERKGAAGMGSWWFAGGWVALTMAYMDSLGWGKSGGVT